MKRTYTVSFIVSTEDYLTPMERENGTEHYYPEECVDVLITDLIDTHIDGLAIREIENLTIIPED